MPRETLESHKFNCSHCGTLFESRCRIQLGSHNAGRNVYCSAACYKKRESKLAKIRIGRHRCGPCPTCKKTFLSKIADKQYCCQQCYFKSEKLKEMLTGFNVPRKKEWKCLECGKDARSKHKFCNDFCRRRFFAARFDRFIANPENIEQLQNFDEFLNRDELPCLFDDCDWVGVSLSHHVNFHHGVTPDKFKEMVGFNRRTALMGVAARQARSETIISLYEEGIMVPQGFPLDQCDRSEKKELRPEGKEHWWKARQLSGAMQSFIEGGVRYSKSKEGRKKSSDTAKKTIANTPKIKLSCHKCGEEYETPVTYKDRSKFCGGECRNRYHSRERSVRRHNGDTTTD